MPAKDPGIRTRQTTLSRHSVRPYESEQEARPLFPQCQEFPQTILLPVEPDLLLDRTRPEHLPKLSKQREGNSSGY